MEKKTSYDICQVPTDFPIEYGKFCRTIIIIYILHEVQIEVQNCMNFLFFIFISQTLFQEIKSFDRYINTFPIQKTATCYFFKKKKDTKWTNKDRHRETRKILSNSSTAHQTVFFFTNFNDSRIFYDLCRFYILRGFVLLQNLLISYSLSQNIPETLKYLCQKTRSIIYYLVLHTQQVYKVLYSSQVTFKSHMDQMSIYHHHDVDEP